MLTSAARASYGLTLVTPPASEPVTLVEAKAHVRVDFTQDDTFINSLIAAARTHCERVLGQAFITQTWKLSLPCFPSWEIALPNPPLVSITSIVYTDPANVSQTLSASLYEVDTTDRMGRVTPVFNGYWPATLYKRKAVEITYVAGYGAASAVPSNIKQAILMLLGHWYRNREAVVTGTIASELQQAVAALLASSWHGTY